MRLKNAACLSCGFVGGTIRKLKGSVAMELVLWLLFFIPCLIYFGRFIGLGFFIYSVVGGTNMTPFLLLLLPGPLYSMWRGNSGYDTCQKCGGNNLVPEDSPVALKFLSELRR